MELIDGKEISETTQRRLGQFDRIVREARELFKRRNEEYGDAFTEWGVLGAVVELTTIAARLRKLVTTTSEEIPDKFRDAINYGVIGLICLEDNNRCGKDYLD